MSSDRHTSALTKRGLAAVRLLGKIPLLEGRRQRVTQAGTGQIQFVQRIDVVGSSQQQSVLRVQDVRDRPQSGSIAAGSDADALAAEALVSKLVSRTF